MINNRCNLIAEKGDGSCCDKKSAQIPKGICIRKICTLNSGYIILFYLKHNIESSDSTRRRLKKFNDNKILQIHCVMVLLYARIFFGSRTWSSALSVVWNERWVTEMEMKLHKDKRRKQRHIDCMPLQLYGRGHVYIP